MVANPSANIPNMKYMIQHNVRHFGRVKHQIMHENKYEITTEKLIYRSWYIQSDCLLIQCVCLCICLAELNVHTMCVYVYLPG